MMRRTLQAKEAAAEKPLLQGLDNELHDLLALVILLREAEEAREESDVDADSLTSRESRHTRLLFLAEAKLRCALVALGQIEHAAWRLS